MRLLSGTRSVRRAALRGSLVILLSAVASLATAPTARAHAVSASVFAQRPACDPRCSRADQITFRTSIRLDTCIRTPVRGVCSVRLRAFVWGQAELLGGWTTIGEERVNVRDVEVGKRVNVAITVPCEGGSVRFRTGSRTRVVGPHTLVTNTPNPNYSRPITIAC